MFMTTVRQIFVEFKSLRSYKHQMFTIDCVKRATNGLGMKRYTPDGITTFAFGHKDIPLFDEDEYNVNHDDFDVNQFCKQFVIVTI